MPDRVPFEYAVIRLVPKVEREEFINIGILLFSKRMNFLGMRYKIDETRIQAFTDEVDIDLLLQYLRAWELICDGDPEGGPISHLDIAERFRWLAAPKSTMIQVSETHAGLCDDPKGILEKLYNRYV